MADKEKKYSDIDLSKYESGFQGSDALTQSGVNKQNAANAYQNWLNTGFSSDYTTLSKDALNAYNDHINKGFSYDFNADALYQQYKDKYIQQGKMAMQDTMGQAAAMTGGYGNSYAATVGNQAYQAQLNNLNDVIPELYQLAYDRYNQQGQNLLNQYSLYSDALDKDYGMWSDKGNLLAADRDYYGQEESNLYNREYGAWNDNKNYDTTQYWNETNYGYAKEQDAIENDRRERELAIQEAAEDRAQKDWEKENAETPAGGGGGGNGGGGGGGSYDNGSLTTLQVKALQNKLGVTVDGYYGEETKKAAGGLSAYDAYMKYCVQQPSHYTNYNDAYKYAVDKGVPTAYASGIMTSSEWQKRKNSYKQSGTGGSEVANYDSYGDYLVAITAYLIEKYT